MPRLEYFGPTKVYGRKMSTPSRWLTLHRALVASVAFVAAALPVVAMAPPAAAAPTAIYVGTLGGPYSAAEAVSGNIVVGYSFTTGVPPHAFAYDVGLPGAAMVDLGTLGGVFSETAAGSDNIVVGSSSTAAGPADAFAYNLAANPPAMADLGTIGGSNSKATAVSGNIVVGDSITASGATHAFAYNLAANPPAMVDLGTLGGGYSSAAAVSGSVVAGYASTQGGDLEMHGSFGSDGHAVAWLLAAPTTTIQLHISAPYQDNGVTVVSLWWTAPPGATSFNLTVHESTGTSTLWRVKAHRASPSTDSGRSRFTTPMGFLRLTTVTPTPSTT